jgi:hypothetical protein
MLLVQASSTFNRTAYYIVWGPQVSAPSFPQPHVANHSVYIIQPANFTSSLVQRLRSVAGSAFSADGACC